MTHQQQIATLMCESPGATSVLSGGAAAQDIMSMDHDSTYLVEPTAAVEEYPEEAGFTPEELKVTKRFIELLGGAERARDALDKVDDCEDCLDIVDAEPEADDAATIGRMADMMPAVPDLPMSMANLYNPSAGSPHS